MTAAADDADDWRPSADLAALRLRARLYALIREFFAARGVLEVETPVLSEAGNSEPNIEAATDQSRTSGLVTSGPKRMVFVCSMHMAMAA